MYNMSDKTDGKTDQEKQSIVNQINQLNLFENNYDFNYKLFQKLNKSFPKLMKHIDLEDMDYIIDRFNLTEKFKKQNIKQLILFLKQVNLKYDEQAKQQEEELQSQIKQDKDYNEINNAIDFFNHLTSDNLETEYNTYEEPQLHKNEYTVDRPKQQPQQNEKKPNFEDLLKQRQMEHQQLLNEMNVNFNSEERPSSTNNQSEIQSESNNMHEDREREVEESLHNESHIRDLELDNDMPNLNENLNDKEEYKQVDESKNEPKQQLRLIQKSHVITINSNDRDLELYPDCNEFSIELYNDEDSNQFENISKYNNIIRIELLNVIVPKYSNYDGNLDNYPYLLLEIEELGGNYSGSNNFLKNTFSKLIFEKTFGKFKSINQITEKEFYPPISFNKLSIKFRKPNGELYNFGDNILELEEENGKQDNHPDNTEIVLFGDTKKIKPVITLDFRITYLTKEIMTQYII